MATSWENGSYEIKDFHIVRTIKELRAMADEARIEMLALLTRAPQTGSEIARAIGIPANRAHYQIRRLIEAGLVRSIESSRRRGWKGERHVVATARHFLVDPQLGCQDPQTSALLQQSIEGAFLDWRRTQLLAIDWTPLAQTLTRDSLKVQSGERVLIAFRPVVLELAEAIAVEIEAVGAVAHPKPWSRNVILRTLDRHSAEELERLRFVPEPIDRELDAVVLVTSSVVSGSLSPTPSQQEKLPILLGSVSRWHRSLRERRLRHMEVALPHRGEFENGTLSIEESIDTFWRCVRADPQALHERGERLRSRVLCNPDIHVWGRNGTDFRFTVEPEQTHVNDGIISDEDMRRGRCSEYIPTGGLSLLPAPNSGDGLVCADYTFSGGRHFRDVRIELREGRIVRIEAREGTDALRAQIDSAAGQPDMISGLGIGLNVTRHGATGKPTLDAILGGVVTVAFGNNELAGGAVNSTLSLSFPIRRLSVDAGTEALVREGRLALGRGA